jgi:hypothetical protein
MGVNTLLSNVPVRLGETAHLVQIYRDPAVLASTIGRYLDEGLQRGEAALVIARTDHWALIRRKLEQLRHDPLLLEEQGRLAFLEVRQTLDAVLRDGMPDRMLFRKKIGPAFAALASQGHTGVRAYGEMVSLLWREGRHDAALHLEALWNELAELHRFTLFCAYEGDCLSPEFHGRAAQDIFREHSHVLPPDDYDRLTSAVDGAMDDVLGGPESAALRPLIAACKRRPTVLPGAHATLHWIQSHLPRQMGDILAAARQRYER